MSSRQGTDDIAPFFKLMLGVSLSMGTDSHGASQLRFISFGLAAARMAGIDSERILNFMTRDKLMTWAASVRDKS